MDNVKALGGGGEGSSSSSGQKFTNEDLNTMHGWTLEHKVQVSQARLLEWYEKWDGQCYVSFSGGKDSVVLAYLAAQVCQMKGYELTLWFCNTGLEFPEIIQHVKFFGKWLEEKFPDTKIDLIIDYPRRGKVDKFLGKEKGTRVTYRDVIQEFGYPVVSKEVSQKIYEARKNPDGASAQRFKKEYEGLYNMSKWEWVKDSDVPISDMCCHLLKERPAVHYEKVSGKKPIIASMATESLMRRSQWLRNGCNIFDSHRPRSNPLSFWRDQDVLEFIDKFKIPIASVYGKVKIGDDGKYYTTGCERTGCYCCMFGAQNEKEPNRFQSLKQTHPKLWEYCMKPFNEGGLGIRKVLEFLHIPFE